MKNKIFIIAILLLNFYAVIAQDRVSNTINSNWQFCKGDTLKTTSSKKWSLVSVPHTWNAEDVNDEEPGYYIGEGWYKKTIQIPVSWKEKEVYIYFEGVGQVAEVYLNGKLVGKHIGSYNAFSFPISNYINYTTEENATNEVIVKVDNSHNENIPPLAADFTFYGGIYRDVYLKAINKVHFDADNYASSGIFMNTPVVNNSNAIVNIKGSLVNKTEAKRKLMITNKIYDVQGKLFSEQSSQIVLNAGQKNDFNQSFNNNGIILDFTPIKGEPILNAIQLKKIY
jgi:beta-galactosidase